MRPMPSTCTQPNRCRLGYLTHIRVVLNFAFRSKLHRVYVIFFCLLEWLFTKPATCVCNHTHLLPPSRKNRSFSSKICSIKTIYLDCNEIHLIKRISSTKKLLSTYWLVRNGWAGLLLVEEGQALAEPAECCRYWGLGGAGQPNQPNRLYIEKGTEQSNI